MLKQARGWDDGRWICPLTTSPTPPGGPLIRIPKGHTNGQGGCCYARWKARNLSIMGQYPQSAGYRNLTDHRFFQRGASSADLRHIARWGGHRRRRGIWQSAFPAADGRMSETIATAQSRTQSRPATAPHLPTSPEGTPMRQEHTRNRWTAPVGSPHRKLARKSAAHDRKLRFAGVGLTDISDRTTRGLF